MSNFRPFNKIIDNPKSVSTIFFESRIIGGVGVIMGSIIDAIFKNSIVKNKPTKLLSFLQFMVASMVVALMYVYIKFEFVEHFQTTIAGMTFAAMYYGVQSNLYSGWQV
jgi:hypothetical protein